MEQLLHPECATASHPCFTDKLALWRSDGAFSLKVPAEWKGPTVREQAREIVDTAKADGRDIQLADPKYRWI